MSHERISSRQSRCGDRIPRRGAAVEIDFRIRRGGELFRKNVSERVVRLFSVGETVDVGA